MSQGAQIFDIEDDLAVYKAAVSARELKRAATGVRPVREQRIDRHAEHERKVRRRNQVLLVAALMLAVVLVTTAKVCDKREPEQAVEQVRTVSALPVLPMTPAAAEEACVEESAEDPQKTEKIATALLANGYLSVDIPMDYTMQDIMRAACEEFGCPYSLALAVAQTESNFDIDAVGAAGEVGIMQLLPGPDGAYHAELEAATGRDPNTQGGNIACGVYLLGKYMAEFQDAGKAAMAYNMGRAGAMEAWAAGITSTDYSDSVLAAMEDWECTVNAWNGQ